MAKFRCHMEAFFSLKEFKLLPYLTKTELKIRVNIVVCLKSLIQIYLTYLMWFKSTALTFSIQCCRTGAGQHCTCITFSGLVGKTQKDEKVRAHSDTF